MSFDAKSADGMLTRSRPPEEPAFREPVPPQRSQNDKGASVHASASTSSRPSLGRWRNDDLARETFPAGGPRRAPGREHRFSSSPTGCSTRNGCKTSMTAATRRKRRLTRAATARLRRSGGSPRTAASQHDVQDALRAAVVHRERAAHGAHRRGEAAGRGQRTGAEIDLSYAREQAKDPKSRTAAETVTITFTVQGTTSRCGG